MSVEGRNYTSNLVKLTKHMDKLMTIQDGGAVSPVMIHMSLTNRCNLECDYCCYGKRDLSEELSFESASSALVQFNRLGTRGVEWTGGGDPSMYRRLDEIVRVASDLGYSQGLISNGIKLDRFKAFDKLSWMRVSLHGLNFDNAYQEKMGRTVERAREINPNIDISSVYIWTTGSEEALDKVVAFTDKYGIPTRLTPDLTLGKESIDSMMVHVGNELEKRKWRKSDTFTMQTSTPSGEANFLFLSDFNVQTTRKHDRCYMHLIKPFVFTDGWVYDCPSLALSPDNHLNVNEKFRVCRIEDILPTYSQPSKARLLDCEFCKYSQQNEFIDDLKRETKHNDFA